MMIHQCRHAVSHAKLATCIGLGLLVVLLPACGDEQALGAADDDDAASASGDALVDEPSPSAPDPDDDGAEFDDQVPPTSGEDLIAWLAEGFHENWRCEEEISPPRTGGVHGYTRVCWNDALVDASNTPFPAGAALVKELYTADEAANGYAVNVKVAEGEGAETWYFFEQIASSTPVADGIAEPVCVECHSRSPNDYIFVRPL